MAGLPIAGLPTMRSARRKLVSPCSRPAGLRKAASPDSAFPDAPEVPTQLPRLPLPVRPSVELSRQAWAKPAWAKPASASFSQPLRNSTLLARLLARSRLRSERLQYPRRDAPKRSLHGSRRRAPSDPAGRRARSPKGSARQKPSADPGPDARARANLRPTMAGPAAQPVAGQTRSWELQSSVVFHQSLFVSPRFHRQCPAPESYYSQGTF